MSTDTTPDGIAEPALIVGDRRYPRSKLADLSRFLDAARVPGSPEETAFEKIIEDGIASGNSAFNCVMPPASATLVIIDPLAIRLAEEDAPAEPRGWPRLGPAEQDPCLTARPRPCWRPCETVCVQNDRR